MWMRFRNFSLLLAATASIGGSLLLPIAPAQAQNILQEQGSLQPVQNQYTFTGRAGQAIVISMNSADFDTVLVLLNASGEEVARNDDYGRSLNSTIVTTLPSDGVYKVLAQSFGGQGGSYTLNVRVATPYDQAYAQAFDQYQQGQYEQAIASYSRAIAVDPNQPAAYADRADARYAMSGESVKTEVIADYQRAADLFQQSGDDSIAQTLRSQIEYLQNPQPETAPETSP